ncbi:MAG TPA: hypothetical protein VJA26_13090 [Gammaproteobacteria bacterium]|nr:hypothetical protein [Gammaproteobacteria bacterium]
MGTILVRRALALMFAVACAAAHAQQSSDRHQWTFELDTSYLSSSSGFDSWTNGGLSKLRHAGPDDGLNAARLFGEYRGRISSAWWTKVVVDYVNDASSGLDVTEAYIDWQPTSRNQHQVKLGAFYPPLSLENGDRGWSSPYTYSYSAINTWIGEEVRPIGAEWSMRRHIGFPSSPHELGAFAAAFYGNDPAGTLLFWRGWSLHDRQSRLNDRLPMPPMPRRTPSGTIIGTMEQSLEPFDEIDHRPGVYGGLEWRYARRVLLQVAHYDNRADPNAFSDGQWAWGTSFSQVAAQVSLPAELGLIAQWLSGETYWIAPAQPDGTVPPFGALVEDLFEAKFLMLTRLVRSAHRFSLRYDDFEFVREHTPGALADVGHAWTFAYRYQRSARLSGGLEWLRVESRRDLWSDLYGADRWATERQVRLQLSVKLGVPRGR